MKIAVTSQNFRTVTGHAGRARRFILFDVAADGTVTESGRLDLPIEQSFHELHGDHAHPVDGVDVLISAEFGAGFAQRMARRGIVAVMTTETEPLAAVRDYLARQAAGTVPSYGGCGCGGGEGHHHHHEEGGCGCGGHHS
jgi:predicted Fe-Mo cluster-binding NifX family protein